MASLFARQVAIMILAAAIFSGFMTYSYVTKSFYFAEVLGGPGGRTLDYLRGQPYSHMVVEVDYAQGRAPSPVALQLLRERLLRYTDKVDITVDDTEELRLAVKNYSSADLDQIYLQHRNYTTQGSRAALYILYLPGYLNGDRHILGLAYNARAFALFRDTYAVPFVDIGDLWSLEASVLVHEAGHILGLVNLVYHSDQDFLHGTKTPYEDPRHPGHTNNQSDVMYWEADVVGRGANATPISDFGYETAHDLQGLRNGTLRLTQADAFFLGIPPPIPLCWAMGSSRGVVVVGNGLRTHQRGARDGAGGVQGDHPDQERGGRPPPLR